MSQSETNRTDSDSKEPLTTTDAFDEAGVEVAARARSKYSRSAHIPVTDADGKVVYYAPTGDDEPGPTKVVAPDHEDAEPRPECGLPTATYAEVDFITAPLPTVDCRPACRYCTGTNADPAAGSANKSFARIMRYGKSWGENDE